MRDRYKVFVKLRKENYVAAFNTEGELHEWLMGEACPEIYGIRDDGYTTIPTEEEPSIIGRNR